MAVGGERTGLGIGVTSTVVPVYLSECSPPAVVLVGAMLFMLQQLSGACSLTGLTRTNVAGQSGMRLSGWSGMGFAGLIVTRLASTTGINAVIYFSSSVFREAGLQAGVLASAGVGLINVLGTLMAGSMLDRYGRKPLLIGSYCGMGLCMLLQAVTMLLGQLTARMAVPCALVGTLAYVLAFAMGAGPIPGLLLGEILPADVRSKASSIAMASHWVFNFAIGQGFLPACAALGTAYVYLGFAVTCFLAAAFSKQFLIETKGRTLEEIETEMHALLNTPSTIANPALS
eukprot:gene527-921_t